MDIGVRLGLVEFFTAEAQRSQRVAEEDLWVDGVEAEFFGKGGEEIEWGQNVPTTDWDYKSQPQSGRSVVLQKPFLVADVFDGFEDGEDLVE